MFIGLSVARVCVGLSLCLGMNLALLGTSQAAIVEVNFETGFDLGGTGFLNRANPGPEPATSQEVGQFTSNGVSFSNVYEPAFGSWSGFAISNHTDVSTPGHLNQYSAYPGSGAGPSSIYGVAYVNNWGVDVSVADDLRRLPSIQLPQNLQAQSMMISNTTYAALAMENGDTFAKKFGGVDGTDADYFKLTVFGIDSNNQVLTESVDFMLADYRFGDSFILGDWAPLNLALLKDAQSLHFSLESSDPGTPNYFAIDNLKLSAVPEPSGLLLLTCLGLGLAFRRSRASDS